MRRVRSPNVQANLGGSRPVDLELLSDIQRAQKVGAFLCRHTSRDLPVVFNQTKLYFRIGGVAASERSTMLSAA